MRKPPTHLLYLHGFRSSPQSTKARRLAAWIAEHRPEVRWHCAWIGEQTTLHDPAERFFFRAEYVDDLRALTPAAITQPQRYLAVVAKGDELLDWREMAARYAGARIKLLEAGDHALSDFDQHLPDLLHFLNLE